MNYELHEFISCFERGFKFKKKFDVITVDWSFFCNQSIVDPLIRICRSNIFSKYVQLVTCSGTLNYLNSFFREVVWFPNEALRTQVPWSSFKKLKWKKAYKSKLCQVYIKKVFWRKSAIIDFFIRILVSPKALWTIYWEMCLLDQVWFALSFLLHNNINNNTVAIKKQ